RALDVSIEEARQLGHTYIGTEHLLLGLMKEGQSIAAKILESLGARLDEVRQETLALLGDQYYPRPKKRSQTPVLDEFARDLTQLARENKLDPGIGRETEIERVIQILARRTKDKPVLIGEPGGGGRGGGGKGGEWRGARAAHRGPRGSRRPRAEASPPARPGRARRGDQVSRSVRGTAEGGDEGDPPVRERGPVPGRAAHA